MFPRKWEHIPGFHVFLNSVRLGFYRSYCLVLLLDKDTHLRKSGHLPHARNKIIYEHHWTTAPVRQGSFLCAECLDAVLELRDMLLVIRHNDLNSWARIICGQIRSLSTGKKANHSLTKYLTALFIINDSPNFVWRSIRFYLSTRSAYTIATTWNHMPILNCLSILCLYFVRYCCSTVW